MDEKIFPWIDDDVAIEIIGRMIAEQTELLYKIVDECKQAGFSYNSQEVLTDARYQQLMMRIGDFKKEIDQIYDGEGLEELYEKVDQEYVPHLNKQRAQIDNQTSVVKFFNESEGLDFIKSENGDNNTFVRASDLSNQVDEDMPIKPHSTTQLSVTNK